MDRPPALAWEKVPFDVGCARCGHDLRGLTDPTCPACELAFEWADAVPVERLTCEQCGYHLYGLTENRCPECGTPFTWNDALAAYHRRRLPLFEHQWRKRPIRSLLTTWRRALRPGKLWRSLDIHDPPRVGPLLVLVALSFLAFMASLVLTRALVNGFSVSIQAGFTGGWNALTTGFVDRWTLRLCYDSAPILALWVATSLGALLVFQQSMAQCRVRPRHVIRVWVFSVAPAGPPIIALFSAPALCYALGSFRRPMNMLPFFAGLIVAFATWSIYMGYRQYLRVPHAAGVAIVSQFIAIVSAGLLEFAVSGDLANTVFYSLLHSVGLAF